MLPRGFTLSLKDSSLFFLYSAALSRYSSVLERLEKPLLPRFKLLDPFSQVFPFFFPHRLTFLPNRLFFLCTPLPNAQIALKQPFFLTHLDFSIILWVCSVAGVHFFP